MDEHFYMIHIVEAHTSFIKQLAVHEDVLFTSPTSIDIFREAA